MVGEMMQSQQIYHQLANQKEYWINVYGAHGFQWQGQCFKDKESVINLLAMATQVLYRIHVKMKPVNPYKPKPIKEVKPIYIKFTEKDMDRLWDW